MKTKPYQNRVSPAGEFLAVPDRGMYMGNRGVLHDAHGRIVRSWRLNAWITCLTQFKDRRRKVFSPGRYSELFFLDEATALAAGHRPCAECRYQDYKRFKRLWADTAASAERRAPKAADMDAALHSHRVTASGRKQTFRQKLSALPDGVFIRLDDRQMYLLHAGTLLAWSPSGYSQRRDLLSNVPVTVLTPRPTVDILSAGYSPVLHESVQLF